MQVTLRVVGGKNDGREIRVAVPRFIIGRGDTAHLRPASDLVSREHCAIEVQDGKVTINDLQSRNGTFVNGSRISEIHVAKSGDAVRIGRLQFEMVIDPVKASTKKPKVSNVVEAASRTAATKKPSLEDSISDWLLESGDDDDDASNTTEKQQIANADTVQLNLEDTTKIRRDVADDVVSDDVSDDVVADAEQEDPSKSGKKKKATPMKLPTMNKPQHQDSTSAADDVLRKFFNRR